MEVDNTINVPNQHTYIHTYIKTHKATQTVNECNWQSEVRSAVFKQLAHLELSAKSQSHPNQE